MAAATFDPFADMSVPPPMKERLTALATKHGITARYQEFRDRPPGKKGPTPEFFTDFFTLSTRFREELKERYPVVCAKFHRSFKTVSSRPDPSPADYGLDVWFSDEVAPMPHGGYPGQQYWFESSQLGQMFAHLHALDTAYRMCETMMVEYQRQCDMYSQMLEKSLCIRKILHDRKWGTFIAFDPRLEAEIIKSLGQTRGSQLIAETYKRLGSVIVKMKADYAIQQKRRHEEEQRLAEERKLVEIRRKEREEKRQADILAASIVEKMTDVSELRKRLAAAEARAVAAEEIVAKLL